MRSWRASRDFVIESLTQDTSIRQCSGIQPLILLANARGHQPGRATRAPGCCTVELGRIGAAGILHAMTRALDAAIAKLSELPLEEQDRIARWLLDELGDEEAWARRFATSQDALSKLAAEARADLAAGRAAELDPDTL